MNVFTAQDASITYRLDMGEGAGGRRKHSSFSIGGIASDADSSDAADMAVDIAGLVEPKVDTITLTRKESMEPALD